MKPLIIIAGPCVVENEKITMQIAEKLKEISLKLPIDLIFKASYRKANRTSGTAFQGIGDDAALTILLKVWKELELKTTTDIHSANEADMVAAHVDILQIPAFLCRQTDLLVAAAKTGLPINIKKGQFMSAEDMIHAVMKIASIESDKRVVMITERGNSFGYNDVVVDMRNIQPLQAMSDKVFVDITHTNGGHPVQSFALARAAVAAGADGIFLETHPDPSKALSDGKNMIPLNEVEGLLKQLKRIREAMV